MKNEIWCLLERGREREIATEAVRLANKMELLTCAVLIGETAEGLAQELGQYGIAKLYTVEPPATSPLSPEDYAHLLVSLIKKSPPHVCLFAASPLWDEVAARVAVRLGVGLITWCVDLNFISRELMAIKKVYNGQASKRMTWKSPPPYLATIAPEIMEAIPAERACLPEVHKERFPQPPSQVKLVGQIQLGWRDMPLTEAIGVLGVGSGVKDSTGISLIERLAQLLDMPMGGTKRADEMGLISRERRIGASGTSIESDVYIAIGISGASHHVVGIRNVKHVVAVNKDKAAPIFDVAELGIVDDFHSVVTSIVKLLSRSDKHSHPEESTS